MLNQQVCGQSSCDFKWWSWWWGGYVSFSVVYLQRWFQRKFCYTLLFRTLADYKLHRQILTWKHLGVWVLITKPWSCKNKNHLNLKNLHQTLSSLCVNLRHPANTRFTWFWLFVTSSVFYGFSLASSSFHLYDQVVKQSLFHLDLEDSFTKAVMQIRLKYGRTVFEVNRAIGGSKERESGENTSGTKIKAQLRYVLNTNRWTLCRIQYACWLLIILYCEDPNLVLHPCFGGQRSPCRIV